MAPELHLVVHVADIEDECALLKPGGLHPDHPVGGCRERVAVENQLVVAADRVAIKKWHAVASGLPPDHLSPQSRLSDLKRRRAQVHDGRRSRRHEVVDRIARVEPPGEVFRSPDILANRHPDPVAADLDRHRSRPRLKIPRLVENIVGRQEGLENFPHRPVLFEHGGGVEKRPPVPRGIHVHATDEEGRLADPAVKLVERGQIPGNKIRFEEQVLRGIAGER